MVTVTGANSLWGNISPFLVGGINIGSGSALGVLNVENGARVEDSFASVATGPGPGMVTVSGMGSTWAERHCRQRKTSQRMIEGFHTEQEAQAV